MISNIILLYHYYIGFILKIKWYRINLAYTLSLLPPLLFGKSRPRWWKSDGFTKVCHLPPGLTILIITGLTPGFKWGRIPGQGGYWHRVEWVDPSLAEKIIFLFTNNLSISAVPQMESSCNYCISNQYWLFFQFFFLFSCFITLFVYFKPYHNPLVNHNLFHLNASFIFCTNLEHNWHQEDSVDVFMCARTYT